MLIFGLSGLHSPALVLICNANFFSLTQFAQGSAQSLAQPPRSTPRVAHASLLGQQTLASRVKAIAGILPVKHYRLIPNVFCVRGAELEKAARGARDACGHFAENQALLRAFWA